MCYSEVNKKTIISEGNMKTANKERMLQWITNQYNKGNISFNHKLQRPVGQWNRTAKSLLIHSLLTGIPVNPIYIIEEDGIMYTIDGSQRTSTCIDYINNVFALNKNTPPITITSNENGEHVSKEYDIAGKKFKKLDEEVQNTLLACSLEFCTLSNYTDDEVKEMFRRQNNGKPLNGKLLRIAYESDAFSDAIYALSAHPFMAKLITPTQRKNGTDRDLIIQALMLIETNQENDFTSFRTNDIDTFVQNYNEESLSKIDVLKEAMDKFDSTFEEIKIPITSVPMILYSGYRVNKDKKSFTKLIDAINNFLAGYEENEEYKKFVQSGTSSSENVRGRFDYWRSMIKTI